MASGIEIGTIAWIERISSKTGDQLRLMTKGPYKYVYDDFFNDLHNKMFLAQEGAGANLGITDWRYQNPNIYSRQVDHAVKILADPPYPSYFREQLARHSLNQEDEKILTRANDLYLPPEAYSGRLTPAWIEALAAKLYVARYGIGQENYEKNYPGSMKMQIFFRLDSFNLFDPPGMN